MPKAKLPTKTKVAARWLLVVGVVLTIWTFVIWFSVFAIDAVESTEGTGSSISSSWFFIPVVGSIFAICSGISLSKKSEMTWDVAIACLFITMICSLVGCYYYLSSYNGSSSTIINILTIVTSIFLLVEPIVPLILILLDKKNYFEMVRQREFEKKELKAEKPEGNN
jgi:glucan phosphoethanolaminetransferase (alkaline phosphatase superfamily)